MSTIKFYKDSNGAFRLTDCTGKLAYINKGDIVSAYAENGVCSMIFSDEVYNRFTNIHNKNTAITDFVNASSVAYNEAGLNAVLSDFFVKSAGISSGVEVINALGYTPASKVGGKVPSDELPSSLVVGSIETSRSQSTDKAVASKLFDDTMRAKSDGVVGKNLFDKNRMVVDGYGCDYQGVVFTGISSYKGALIPVLPNTLYSFNHSDNEYSRYIVGQMAYLNASGVEISAVDMQTLSSAGGNGGKQFTTPANCYFVLHNVVVGSINYIDTFQLELGANTTSYEQFSIKLSDSAIPNSLKGFVGVDILKYVEKNIGKNKFNKNLIIEGKFIGFTGFPPVFTGISNGSNSSISGYQPVLPNTQYTLSGVVNNGGDEIGIFVDSDLNVLNSGSCFLTNSTFTTPENCAYILFVTRYNNASFDYSKIQLELGSAATSYEQYNVIGGYPANIFSNWKGKKILWMGTSIPNGNPSVTTPYPIVAGSLLGASVLNVALSGSLMRISKADGTQNTNTDYHTKNFARTKQEFQDLLSQFGVVGGSYPSYPSYTQAQIDSFKLNSYEEKLLTHTDCDLFVFDFSWNDYICDPSDMGAIPADITSRDRAHQWGAFNYCIDKLLTAKPNARFVIVGYWADYQLGKTNDIHKALADYWCVPYFNLAKSLGWSNITNPGTGNPIWKTFCPDGIHPQSDTTGVAEYEIGRICAGLINQV